MNIEVAEAIKSKLVGLSFADKIVGMVQTVSVNKTNSEGLVYNERYPVSCNRTYTECERSGFSELIPNSTYKSILYFEDGGSRFDDKNVEASLRLVCWANLKKLGKGEYSSASMIAEIMGSLPRVPFNTKNLMSVFVEVQSQDIRNQSIFSQYTYKEEQTQYLFYPFDYFALNLNVTYRINPKCYHDYNEFDTCA